MMLVCSGLAFYFLLTKSIKSTSFPNKISVGLMRPCSGPFSNFKTPLGQTALQIPQPTQLERTMFSNRNGTILYCRK